ncbi:hypothetical protein Leryth_008556 [Lithospermum erythrorhizon]|nr:hypothetical protein Leryth_008556 [Lithospermum erythrorhizon]
MWSARRVKANDSQDCCSQGLQLIDLFICGLMILEVTFLIVFITLEYTTTQEGQGILPMDVKLALSWILQIRMN